MTLPDLLMIGLIATGVIVWFLGAVVGVTWLACAAMDALERRRRRLPVATVVDWTELRKRLERKVN